jgi:hypothetical protein
LLTLTTSVFFLQATFADTPVASPEEQIRMAAYLKDFYKDIQIVYQFTEHGKLVSCVDIYTQPSLNHPSLRNHDIQRQPSPDLMKILAQQAAVKGYPTDSPFVSKCPSESIPIHLYTLEEVARFKTLKEFQSKPFATEDFSVRRKGATALHQYATIHQDVDVIASQSTLNI